MINSTNKNPALSSVAVRRVTCKDIQMVQNLVEQCLQLYMSKKEAIEFLLEHAEIERGFTELVWQKLEEENRDFFKAYHLRLMVKQQIMEYNKLLEQQVQHMPQVHLNGAPSAQNRNDAHVPSIVNQHQVRYAPKASDQSSINPSSAYLNGLHTNIPSSMDFSTHSRRVNLSPNIHSFQATNMPSMQGMIKSKTAVSNCAPYVYANLAPSAVGDAAIASFSNDSSNQSLNDPVVDADAFLGQIPRNFSLSDLTADFSQDILESYDGSPFLLDGAENFLDSIDMVEHQGNHERLRTISESFSFGNLGSM